MKLKVIHASYLLCITAIIISCKPTKTKYNNFDERGLDEVFGDNLKLNNKYTYSYQTPEYVSGNSHFNSNIDANVAMLGRVLFYDKKLSLSENIACATCHVQSKAFGAETQGAKGETGNTLRQPMRLVNLAHNPSNFFFWDGVERSSSKAMVRPIKNHLEMGFSGEHNQPTINALLTRLNNTKYYRYLTGIAFKDNYLSEEKLGQALAAFILSINSFDSKYDGERKTKQNTDFFSSFTATENKGKQLFINKPNVSGGIRTSGGLGCIDCHSEGESFQSSSRYEDNSFSNTGKAGNNGISLNLEGKEDVKVNKAPSVRNLFNSNFQVNGFFMSNGFTNNPMEMLEHYNQVHLKRNSHLDNKFLHDNVNPVNLKITQQEKESLLAFLKTLTGKDIYTNPKWSDPFLK